MNNRSKLPAQPVKGLIDGVEVLYALAAAQAPVSGRELAAGLGIEPTRVNRILKTFDYLGIANRTPARRYQPGPGIHVLAARSMFGSGLLSQALPVLDELSRGRPGLRVALGVLWRDSVSYFYHRESPSVSLAEALSNRDIQLFPATRSSVGMVLLSQQDPEEVANLYRHREIPGFRDAAELLDTLAATARRGYALVVNDAGGHSIAVAVGSPAYAGLAFSSAARANGKVESMVCELRNAATLIGNHSAANGRNQNRDRDSVSPVPETRFRSR